MLKLFVILLGVGSVLGHFRFPSASVYSKSVLHSLTKHKELQSKFETGVLCPDYNMTCALDAIKALGISNSTDIALGVGNLTAYMNKVEKSREQCLESCKIQLRVSLMDALLTYFETLSLKDLIVYSKEFGTDEDSKIFLLIEELGIFRTTIRYMDKVYKAFPKTSWNLLDTEHVTKVKGFSDRISSIRKVNFLKDSALARLEYDSGLYRALLLKWPRDEKDKIDVMRYISEFKVQIAP